MNAKRIPAILLVWTLAAGALIACGQRITPLTAEEPAVAVESESFMKGELETYHYYDVNKCKLRWLMSESEAKTVFEEFEEYSVKNESENEVVGIQFKSVTYDLELKPDLVQALGSTSELHYCAVSLDFFKIEDTFRLSNVDYSYYWSNDEWQDGETFYSVLLGELTGYYGQPGYHLATDFSDIKPHRLFKDTVYYTADRWHVGHNFIELHLDVRYTQEPFEGGREYYSFSVEERYIPFASVMDLEYDPVSENSPLLRNFD